MEPERVQALRDTKALYDEGILQTWNFVKPLSASARYYPGARVQMIEG